MDTPLNRMSKPGRKPEGTFKVVDAPPIVLERRVHPCICPLCGKGQAPRVLRTNDGYADVSCASCGRNFQYHYGSSGISPRVRFVPRV